MGFIVIFLIINKKSIVISFTGVQFTDELSHAWLLITTTVIGLGGVLSRSLSKKIEWCWFKISGLLGFVVPKLILTIIFFVVLFPVALLSRVFSKSNPLSLKNNKDSLFQHRHGSFEKSSFEDLW